MIPQKLINKNDATKELEDLQIFIEVPIYKH